MVILTVDQVRDVVAKLRGRAIYPAAITALFTGLRRGELLALRWCNVELDGPGAAVAHIVEAIEETKGKAGGVRFKKTKTSNRRRDITLPDIVVEALRQHRRRQLELRVALGLGRLSDAALLFRGSTASLRARMPSRPHGAI
jgi:integrase